MKPVIHKAVRPKRNYADPTLCIASRRMARFTSAQEPRLHAASRTTWKGVNCRACLRRRRENTNG